MDRDHSDTRRNEASAADVLLGTLRARGVEYFLANPGTDFPPIIESFAAAAESGRKVPHPMVIPHENAAVAMAHGYYLVSGRPQAVMVHTSVGTGNTLNTLINASRDNIPILLLAGRSPLTETGGLGTRTRAIHWAQEMFDQAGMVRELVKWDYELNSADHVDDVVTRAIEIAMTSPRGPVYLTLPRETLAAMTSRAGGALPRRALPAPPHPDPAAIATLADWIATAQRPLVITSNAGRTAEDVAALERIAQRFALPVISFRERYLALSNRHPMHQGFLPRPLLSDADAIVVLDCDVPWIPSLESPKPDCRVAHIGEDPTFARYPMRSFPADLSIAAAIPAALGALERALESRVSPDGAAIAARRRALSERSTAQRTKWAAESERDGQAEAITPAWISRCIGEAVGEEAIIVNEYPLRLEHCPRTRPGTYFGLSPAGGLGWGLGAALGAKLAARDRLVVATLGDGAYTFANPTACHWTAQAHDLPILTVVFNNSLYGAVRGATLEMYGQGAAARTQGRLMAELGPSTAFEMLAEANGGLGLRVDRPADLPG
ncbi:MAG TPA: thiamine pyrophosphate-requiring protein, partial [Stellaceae bacterium]|nr:thiamine pyrophosphate-requiring protein [Stellaceae bacterium]